MSGKPAAIDAPAPSRIERCRWGCPILSSSEATTAAGAWPGEEVDGAFYISPFVVDSDEDGLNDCYEVIDLGTNPSSMFTLDNPYRDRDMDFDEDGLSNMEEFNAGTDPWNKDTDGDGLTDGAELKVYFTDPLNPDTDGDGITDGEEIIRGTDPLSAS